MAKPIGVWGIDIGQCALKTMRCHMEGDQVVADAFDYIEYPKILSQPEANPVELIKEALEQFLSRNDVRGDRVAISVSGQAGLARYFKPPPVDATKIAEIVKYEAKQQIPFPLEDVIWDYQRMGGGMEVDGIALETEVGLFAMKREQVYKALQPFLTAGIEVDIIQLAPLGIYNYVVYDLLDKTLPPPDQFDPENPPPSTVVIAMGTDTTDLVVTNGYRVWQRNIPLGGNHFTKQLTKELKLTFAKAEHLKRNAHQAEDPKAVFQAMRPIFNDVVMELQRSIRHFQNLDRKAEVDKVVVLGNTVKLPGLKQYLAKHLGYEVIDFDAFSRLTGDNVTKAPAFKDNLLAFGVCYGLCLQALEKGRLATNLLPQEIETQRMVKAKKPWAVAIAALFLLACAFNYIFHFVAWKKVHLEDWQDALTQVTNIKTESDKHKSTDEAKKKELENLQKLAEEVEGNADRRILWLEFLKANNEALPKTPGRNEGQVLDPKKVAFDKQHEIHIESFETQYFAKLEDWYGGQNGLVKEKYLQMVHAANPAVAAANLPNAPESPATPGAALPAALPAAAAPAAPPAVAAPVAGSTTPATGTTATGTEVAGPTGPGWVIELKGYHFYNSDRNNFGPIHVRRTLLKQLEDGVVELPTGAGGAPVKWKMKELGIGYAIFADDPDLERNYLVPNPSYEAPKTEAGGFSISGSGGNSNRPAVGALKEKSKDDSNPEFWKVTRYSFIVQYVWQEKPLQQRLEARRKAAEEAKMAASGEGALTTNNVPPTTVPPDSSEPTTPPAAPTAVVPPVAVPAVAPMPMPVEPMPVEPMPVEPMPPVDKGPPAPELPDPVEAAPAEKGGA